MKIPAPTKAVPAKFLFRPAQDPSYPFFRNVKEPAAFTAYRLIPEGPEFVKAAVTYSFVLLEFTTEGTSPAGGKKQVNKTTQQPYHFQVSQLSLPEYRPFICEAA
jgi:hypothetical protein